MHRFVCRFFFRFVGIALALGLCVLLLAPPGRAAACPLNGAFQALASRISDIVGECRDAAWSEPAIAEMQRTTRGLLVWRQLDNHSSSIASSSSRSYQTPGTSRQRTRA